MADADRKCDIIIQTAGKWRDTQIEENALRWNPVQQLIERWNGEEWVSILPTKLEKYGITDVYTKDDTQQYIASRQEKSLITNGDCSMRSNYNFSQMTYDATDSSRFDSTPGFGCLTHTSSSNNKTLYSDEYIPVDTGNLYTVEYDLKLVSGDNAFQDCLACYDIDKNFISSICVKEVSGSRTTLAQDLKNGDTRIYLTGTDGFNKSVTSTNARGLIFWDYEDSLGRAYGTLYSRHYYTNVWADSDSFQGDVEPFIVPIKAWSGGTIPAGTEVSQTVDTTWNVYGHSSNFTVTALDTWNHITATYSTGGNTTNVLFNATAYVRFALLMNRSNSGTSSTVKLSNVSAQPYFSRCKFADKATQATLDSAGNTISSTYFKNAGGTVTGTIASTVGKTDVTGAVNKILTATMGNNDTFFLGTQATANDAGAGIIATLDNGNEPIYVRQYTTSGLSSKTPTHEATLLDASGKTSFPVSVTAPSFVGNLSGTASNATNAVNAEKATDADNATNAVNAEYATMDSDGNNIAGTYAPSVNFQVVDALPESPVDGVFYFVLES